MVLPKLHSNTPADPSHTRPSPRPRFTFGRPDVELLRQFCAAKFGWEVQYAEQQLAPVVQAYDQRQVGWVLLQTVVAMLLRSHHQPVHAWRQAIGVGFSHSSLALPLTCRAS